MKPLILAFLLLMPAFGAQATRTRVSLGWDAAQATPGTTLVGYKLFWGESGHPTTSNVSTSPFVLSASLSLKAGTVYNFFVVALYSDGRASGPSNWVVYTTPRR